VIEKDEENALQQATSWGEDAIEESIELPGQAAVSQWMGHLRSKYLATVKNKVPEINIVDNPAEVAHTCDVCTCCVVSHALSYPHTTGRHVPSQALRGQTAPIPCVPTMSSLF
jgi:hypothetical protein